MRKKRSVMSSAGVHSVRSGRREPQETRRGQHRGTCDAGIIQAVALPCFRTGRFPIPGRPNRIQRSSAMNAPHRDNGFFTESLSSRDPELYASITGELGRQRDEIELIASENIVSKAVMEAQGSVMTNKYAEGYPGRRYYGGCQYV